MDGPDKAWQSLGEIVRRRRLELELTQDAAAAKAGLSPTTWVDLEAGRRKRGLTLSKAAKALDWSSDTVEELYAREMRRFESQSDLDELREMELKLSAHAGSLSEHDRAVIEEFLRTLRSRLDAMEERLRDRDNESH